MSHGDWRWQITEAIERIRTRYDFIGRKTGAPFLAVVYPPEVEDAVLNEWHTQCQTLQRELDVHSINLLDVTQSVVNDIGAVNIVDAINNPMPGSNPESEIGRLWIDAVLNTVKVSLESKRNVNSVVILEKLAALYPAAGPRDIMQTLWDNPNFSLTGPVVVLIPGYHRGFRTYSFLGLRDEFMYRGDVV